MESFLYSGADLSHYNIANALMGCKLGMNIATCCSYFLLIITVKLEIFNSFNHSFVVLMTLTFAQGIFLPGTNRYRFIDKVGCLYAWNSLHQMPFK